LIDTARTSSRSPAGVDHLPAPSPPAALGGQLTIQRRKLEWPDIAKDMVIATMFKGESDKNPYREVIEGYKLTPSDLAFLKKSPVFKNLLRAELRRAEDLGDKASYIFKAELMTAKLADTLFERLLDSETPINELRLGYEAIAKASGLYELPQPKMVGAPGQSGVNIQINIPELPGGKLSHVKHNGTDD
jgi:hypothetical protein